MTKLETAIAEAVIDMDLREAAAHSRGDHFDARSWFKSYRHRLADAVEEARGPEARGAFEAAIKIT